MAIDIIARGMIESSKNDISQLFDITKGGEIVNNEFSYTLNNAVDYPLLGINLYGKSTQDGTPTPTNPVDIVSVGDGGAVEITACGKNLVDPSKITNGGFNYDTGTELNNSARARTGYIAVTPAYLVGSVPDGYSILSIYHYTATKEFLGVGGVSLLKGQNGFIRLLLKRNDGAKITDDDLNTLKSSIIVTNGESVEYEPYKGSTASITTALPLCSVGDVCDELIYNADGTGKIIKRTGLIIVDGSEDEGWQIADNAYFLLPGVAGNLVSPNAISTVGIVPYTQLYSGYGLALAYGIRLRFEQLNPNNNTVAELKVYLADNPITVVYQRAKPQEIELTAAEMAALRELQTFDGVTNITNGSGADMDVKICTNKMLSKYVKPITTGLQKQINELKAAVISLGGNV